MSDQVNNQQIVQEPRQYRVKLMCCWTSSKQLCDIWNRQSQGNYKWNNITVTYKDEKIDYYVIINSANGEYYDPAKTIIFHMEPAFVRAGWEPKWKNPDEKQFLQVRSHDKFMNNAEWHLGKTYTELMNEKITKTKIFSTVTSSSYMSDYHKKRVNFIKFLEMKGVDIDIFGRSNNVGYHNYKGACPWIDKTNGLYPYKYTFAAENSKEHNYVTEKLFDAILSECLCFYDGCPNVTDYINRDAIIQIDLNNYEKSYEIITAAIANDEWSKRIEIIREEKMKILNELQFFPMLEKIINEHQAKLKSATA